MGPWLAAAVFVGFYAALIGDWWPRWWVALAAAGLVVVLGLVPWSGVAAAIDFNTLALLLGMMVLVAVLGEAGLFEGVAAAILRLAGTGPRRLVFWCVVLTAAVSAFLDNVTTMLLLGPILITVAETVGLDPVALLAAATMASNLGGVATLVGDPPNILIGTAAGLDFVNFLRYLGPVAAVLVLTVGVALALTVGGRAATTPRPASPHSLARTARMEAQRARRHSLADRLPRLLAVAAATVAAMVAQPLTGWPVGATAVVGAAAALAAARAWSWPTGQWRRLAAGVQWSTLGFFLGVFVLVGSLVHTGLIAAAAGLLATAGRQAPLGAAALVYGGSALASALVDNVPLVAAAIPVIAPLASAGSGGVQWWMMLALGSAIGGNATVVGASANLVTQGLLQGRGYSLSFARYLRLGIPVSALALVVGWIAIGVFGGR